MKRLHLRPRAILLSCVVTVLLSIVVYAMHREFGTGSVSATVTAARLPVEEDARQALSAEEEAYAAALWPLHSEVKLAAVQMTFAGITYKTEDHDPGQLVAKVRPLGGTLETIAERVRSLEPPSSLHAIHNRYVEALDLYGAASAQMVRGASENRDELLITAQEMSFRASEDLLRVSDVLWPGEYRPH